MITGVYLNILPSSDDKVVAIASLEFNNVIQSMIFELSM